MVPPQVAAAAPPAPTDGAATFRDGASIVQGKDTSEEALAIRLKKGTPLHEYTVQQLKKYLELAYRNIQKRFADWDRVNDNLRMYVNLEAMARKGDKSVDPDKREMPFQRSVMIPVSYAIYKIILTEMFSIFASRIPFLRISGRGPEDEATAPHIEALLDYDHMQTRGSLSVYSLLADTIRYGQGTIYDYWEEETEIVDPTEGNPIAKMAMAMGIVGPDVLGPRPVATKECNKSSPVDPYTWWRDPRVSIANVQEGDFCGHRAFKSHNWMLMRSMESQRGPYFNLEDLKSEQRQSKNSGRDMEIVQRTRFADDQFGFRLQEKGGDQDKGYHALDHFQVRLIPANWGPEDGEKLGSSTAPEIWWFTLGDEKTIVRAHENPFDHGQFTYSASEYDPDPHAMFSPGLIEDMDGPQRLINWFVNSHVENVRKTINNEIIWSPRFFEASSFLNPAPARWIEMTEELANMVASGRQINEFYQQLQVADITTGHLRLVEFFMEMINRMAGTTDPMAGIPTQEQKTLGEINLMQQGASKRNAVVAAMIDLMAFQPWAYRQIANRQQYTSIEQYVRILGSQSQKFNPATGRPELVPINRDQISGKYDYIPHSALGAADPRRAAETWLGILRAYGEFPPLSQPDDQGRIPDYQKMFGEAVRGMGVRDLDSFYRLPPPPQSPPGTQIVVVPDQIAQEMAQAGNAIPYQPPWAAGMAPPA